MPSNERAWRVTGIEGGKTWSSTKRATRRCTDAQLEQIGAEGKRNVQIEHKVHLRISRQSSEVALEVEFLSRGDAVQYRLVDATGKVCLILLVPFQSLERGVDELHHVAKKGLRVLPRLPVANDVVKLVCVTRFSTGVDNATRFRRSKKMTFHGLCSFKMFSSPKNADVWHSSFRFAFPVPTPS